MNKEEKKAIKVINKRTKRLLDELEIEKEDMLDEPRIAYLMQEIRANKTILNLIEKLQKENESLKEYNMEYKRILDLANDRIYRKKYLEERRKEQPTLLYPDGDEIYQRYYELKQENEELKEKSNISKTGSDYWCMKYAKLQKENEEIKNENKRLKVIKYSTEYGTENIHLITKSDLVQIDINKYMIEIEKGKFVDLKQVYQENEKLKNDYENLNNSVVVKNHCIKNSIPVQEVKDKIEELKEQYNVRELDFIKTTRDIRKIIIQALEELIEGRKLEEDKL
jgi:hypothetical protein